MKHNITDLTGHLFEQLERLNEVSVDSESLEKEIGRAKAVSGIAETVIKAGELALDAQKFIHDDRLDADRRLPKLLGDSDNETS